MGKRVFAAKFVDKQTLKFERRIIGQFHAINFRGKRAETGDFLAIFIFVVAYFLSNSTFFNKAKKSTVSTLFPRKPSNRTRRMINMKTFTEIDKHEGRCTEAEINQPWEDRWGIPDLQAGLCIPLALGKRKTQSDMEQPEYLEEEPFIPSDAVLEQAKARGIPLDDGDAIFGLAFELDPAGVMKRNPTIYLDWQRQKRLERVGKASQSIQLAELTATKLKGMPTQDILTKIMQGIFAEPEETRDRILERMGIDVAGFLELLEQSD